MLVFKVYMNGSKWKSIKLNNLSVNLLYIRKIIVNKEFEFFDVHNKKDLTDKFIIAMLKEKELKQTGDINLLNRIISNNGFISYIKQLENL